MVDKTEKWISTMINALDDYVDEKTRVSMLEQCGRQCQSAAFIKKAKAIYQKSTGINDFLDNFSKVYTHLHRKGNVVYIVYPRCYCTQVNNIPKGELSGTYCNCSMGWAKALFEGATGKPVEVMMEKTIIKGDSECKFRIDFLDS